MTSILVSNNGEQLGRSYDLFFILIKWKDCVTTSMLMWFWLTIFRNTLIFCMSSCVLWSRTTGKRFLYRLVFHCSHQLPNILDCKILSNRALFLILWPIDFCSLKILQTIMLLTCLQNMAQPILSSMMIYRYVIKVELILTRICVFFTNLFLVQGTASVVLAGLVAAQKLLGGTLADHKFLFLGAGEVRFCSPLLVFFHSGSSLRKLISKFIDSTFATFLQAGTGIAELIALEMSKQVLACYPLHVSCWIMQL